MIIFMMTLMMAMIILTVIGIMIPPCDSTCVELSALHSLHCLFPGVGGGGKAGEDGGVFVVVYQVRTVIIYILVKYGYCKWW